MRGSTLRRNRRASEGLGCLRWSSVGSTWPPRVRMQLDRRPGTARGADQPEHRTDYLVEVAAGLLANKSGDNRQVSRPWPVGRTATSSAALRPSPLPRSSIPIPATQAARPKLNLVPSLATRSCTPGPIFERPFAKIPRARTWWWTPGGAAADRPAFFRPVPSPAGLKP